MLFFFLIAVFAFDKLYKRLRFLKNSLSNLFEVSIGHALVCDAFEYGLKDTIQKYLTITNR